MPKDLANLVYSSVNGMKGLNSGSPSATPKVMEVVTNDADSRTVTRASERKDDEIITRSHCFVSGLAGSVFAQTHTPCQTKAASYRSCAGNCGDGHVCKLRAESQRGG